jgi:hypothetical protein
VSSTTSCNNAAAIEVAPISEATILPQQWKIKAHLIFFVVLYASTETSKALRINFLSSDNV